MPRLGRKAAFSTLWRIMIGTRGGPPLGRRLAAVPRMIWATLTGRYDGKARLLAMVVATAYIASPVDLVPELVLTVLGLADDAVVAVWLAGALLAETERFLEWERRRDTVIEPGSTRVRPRVREGG